MWSIYIVHLLGGMFFGWIFLFTSIDHTRPRLPYHIPNIQRFAAIQDELSSSGKRKPYQVVDNNNHTHFVFKKEIPPEMDGKDCRPRPPEEGSEEEAAAAEIHKMRGLFHKLAILNQLSAPGNPIPKLDMIRKEHLEIYGEPEIRGVNVEKWLEGFAEFWEDTGDF